MKQKLEKSTPAVSNENPEKDNTVSLDIGRCYRFEPENFEINIQNTQYANSTFIQVMGKDVFIDFLVLPGTKKEGKMTADATRIYMTHIQAKKMADALNAILENTYKAGQMETYPPKN